MPDGIEQIESRLAAYIDGELADADRAEIEKYLAANPSHGQLIEELRQQKARVASLPRESAPVEVLDHLQSHLERQALLENVEDGAGSMRINRWPQWGAVAAMLLLTVGLGALVFSVLPGGVLNHETVAIAPPSMQNLPSAPSLDGTDKAPEERDAVASSGLVGEKDADAFVGKTGGSRLRDASTADALREPEDIAGTAAKPGTFSKGGAGDVRGDMPSDALGLSLNNGSAIVVSTDDPLITQNLLAGYLGQNNYDYTPVRAEVARASIAMNRANLSDNVAEQVQELQTQQQVGQSQADVAEQALGSVALRVSAKEKSSSDAEQYLVVRNVTPADAQRINGVINTQRGMRQQARFYGNRDLYPEFTQQSQQYANQGQQLQQLQQKQEQVAQAREANVASRPEPESKDQLAAEHAEKDLKREGALTKNDVDEPFEIAPGAQAKVMEPTTVANQPPAPATALQDQPPGPAPTADETAERIDVLILVRNDPALEPTATQPTTQSTTQPASQPANSVDAIDPIHQADPINQLDPPLNTSNPPILLTPEPTTQPTTQPAP